MDQSYIDDLIDHPKVLETREHVHHGIAKYDHILRVTRYSYYLARMVKADVRVCVRAGLIHDIDSRYGTLDNHGGVAARWAAEIGEDEAVCAAIIGHMYPIGPPPTTREGWVLTIADKAASIADLSEYVRGVVTGKSRRRKEDLQTSDPFYRRKERIKARQRLKKLLEIDL